MINSRIGAICVAIVTVVGFGAAPVHGQLLGLTAELVDPVAEGWDVAGYDASALDTFRVYAVFDQAVSVVGLGDSSDDSILFDLTLSNGQFYNDGMGSDLPPNSSFTGTFPSMLWDTFVTIGEPTGLGPGGVPVTSISPDFGTQAAGLVGSFSLVGDGWYVAGFPAQGDSVADRVLVAQFTVDQGEQVSGTNWRISGTVGGQGGAPLDMFADFVTPDLCQADFNGNNQVAFEDLTQLLVRWGTCVGCAEDLDMDDSISFNDLTELLGMWGFCP